MPKNNSGDYLNRLYSILIYVLPLTGIYVFRGLLLREFPILASIFLPVFWLDEVLSISILNFVSVRLVIWLFAFAVLVKNYGINHFFRFNLVQSLLLDVSVSIVREGTDILILTLSPLQIVSFILTIILSTTVLAMSVSLIYTVFQCIRGKYADKIPLISDTAYYWTRF